MYHSMDMEMGRLLHEERLAASKHNRLLRELELAQRAAAQAAPQPQMRQLLQRMMHLLF